MNELDQKFCGIQAVIIDLDGTMLDTAADFQCAINLVRAELKLAPLELQTITNFVGKGSENLIKNVLALDFDEKAVGGYFDAALTSYQKHYAAINGEHAKLFPDVVAGLELMQARGLRLACVTNKPIAFTLPLLKKMRVDHYFNVIYGGDSFVRKKPDPFPFLKVCADFKLMPKQIVAIGDSSNDAQAARAAGCWILTVPYGYNHGEPIQSVDCDGIVATLLVAAQRIST